MQSIAKGIAFDGRAATLERLAEAIASLEHSFAADPEGGCTIPTGWADVDQLLGGGLAAGGLHEWIADGRTVPSLCVLTHLARRAMNGLSVVWIGKACWPYPQTLVRAAGSDRALLERSIFINAESSDERVWATDLALRCRAIAVVVADGSGFGFTATRRLHLAAAQGRGVGLLAREWAERREFSAARTRWLVRSEPTETEHPAWSVELLRCKGVRPLGEGARWIVQHDHETGDVRVDAAAGGGPGAAARPAVRQTA